MLLMNLSKKLLLAVCILFGSLQLLAQTKVLTGKITASKENVPISGDTVNVKGTSNSVATSSDGSFSISVNTTRPTLIISSVNYVKKEVTVNANESNIAISLDASEGTLGEVVVVGYGVQKKSDLTGSISSIKGSEVTQLSTQRVDQALQGRASGVYVLNTDGAPGGNTTIRVRGMNSINGGNNALVVIDGLQGGNLNSLNPNDIESIEILKDASATAIYGSRGANGVILITTKSGRKGKPVIDYGFSYGSQRIRHKLDLMNAADYARTRNADKATQNASGTPVPIFSDERIAELEKNGGTDWQDVIYRT